MSDRKFRQVKLTLMEKFFGVLLLSENVAFVGLADFNTKKEVQNTQIFDTESKLEMFLKVSNSAFTGACNDDNININNNHNNVSSIMFEK